MPYFLVERTFASEEEPRWSAPGDSLEARRRFLKNNQAARVVWLRSFVTPDRQRSFCLYDGPSPEAVRLAADLNGLPVDRISEIHVQAPNRVSMIEGPNPSRVLKEIGMNDEIQEEYHDQSAD